MTPGLSLCASKIVAATSLTLQVGVLRKAPHLASPPGRRS